MVGFIIAPSKIQKTVALWARFMGGMRQWTNGSRSTFPVGKVETLYNALQRRSIVEGIDGQLGAHGTAHADHAFVDDAVINLNPIAAAAQNARPVQGVQMLRHIGLGGVDALQQLAHVFFALAQGADDFQAQGCLHHSEGFGGIVKHLVRGVQR